MATELNKGFFIIGTDTDIGKTYVSTLLYKSLKDIGGGYYKPVQSGCIEKDGMLKAPDVDFLCNFNKIPYDRDMVTYTLKAEVSPHLAAELENIEIDSDRIIKKWEELKKRYRYMIVEGAGGLHVPLIRDKFYIYNLIKLLNLPVVVVSSAKVGSINHAVLTVESLKNMKIEVQGIIFNKVTGDKKEHYYEDDNIDIILKLTGIKNHLIIKKGATELDREKVIKFLGIEGMNINAK